jgi:hypothetical protein
MSSLNSAIYLDALLSLTMLNQLWLFMNFAKPVNTYLNHAWWHSAVIHQWQPSFVTFTCHQCSPGGKPASSSIADLDQWMKTKWTALLPAGPPEYHHVSHLLLSTVVEAHHTNPVSAFNCSLSTNNIHNGNDCLNGLVALYPAIFLCQTLLIGWCAAEQHYPGYALSRAQDIIKKLHACSLGLDVLELSVLWTASHWLNSHKFC